VKYFTPDRLVRLQDHSDEKRYLAALGSWEKALRYYREHLQKIGDALPRGLRNLLRSTALHDAAIVDMWHRNTRFNITLLPESDRTKLVILSYSLVEAPQISREALPFELRASQATWLYDELDVQQSADAQRRRLFTHHILLSNGWEIELRFRSVAVSRAALLVPAAS
jgi:hypothetical protein